MVLNLSWRVRVSTKLADKLNQLMIDRAMILSHGKSFLLCMLTIDERLLLCSIVIYLKVNSEILARFRYNKESKQNV